jgi:hypothetical protein
MTDSSSGNRAAVKATLTRLRDLRRGLLRLHKRLLDAERAWYEQAHGRVSSTGEMLQLVIHDEQFAWLHSISELIVRIDEALDMEEPMTEDGADALFAETRTLLTPSETGDEFARKYFAALQSDPEIILTHREVVQFLKDKP